MTSSRRSSTRSRTSGRSRTPPSTTSRRGWRRPAISRDARSTAGAGASATRSPTRGREALRAWADTPGAPPSQYRDEGMLKVFAGADPQRVFAGRGDWHRAKLAELEGYMEALRARSRGRRSLAWPRSDPRGRHRLPPPDDRDLRAFRGEAFLEHALSTQIDGGRQRRLPARSCQHI